MRRILLVEPAYKNKYPPMGLMKISTYHKNLGDEVHFVKGIDHTLANQTWDRIYVTTLFTFYFDITIATINYYKTLVDDLDDFYVGGIMSSLMTDSVLEATGLQRRNILVGLFTDTSVVRDNNDINVDTQPLDYDILEEIDYKYPAGDNYFAYTTRGCPNHCQFCAVPILEPNFCVTNNIVEQIRTIDEKYGPKQNLLMLDNNILNAPNLREVVDSLCEAGFARGAKFNPPGDYMIIMHRYHNGDRAPFLDARLRTYLYSFKKRIKNAEHREKYLNILIESEETDDFSEYMLQHEAELTPIIEKYRSKASKLRYIDFNQGVDGRKITHESMAQLARLAIKPLRIAFDDIRLKETYINAVEIAHHHGVNEISNYMLFNFKDKPEDLYERLEVNIKLNEKLGISIFSFPMRYAPVNMTDRSYVGEYWTVKELRAISAILQVTKGVVAAGTSFFYKAFGKDKKEYQEILAMPRDFIIFRHDFEESGDTARWREAYTKLDARQKKELLRIVSVPVKELRNADCPPEFASILPFYFVKHKETSKLAEDEDQMSFYDED